jgi:hypothetical protein
MRVRNALIVLVAALAAGQAWLLQPVPAAAASVSAATSAATWASRTACDAHSQLRPGSRIVVTGVVQRVLPDDNSGSRHQRFIVTLPSGQTVLIAHNIDIAPRVEGIARGDTVSLSGIYEANNKGGVVHWTHHDPSRRHPAGWIEHRGHRYQ